MGVLKDGVDLLFGLKQIALEQKIQTGRIGVLGGLSSVVFAAYDFVNHYRQEPLRFEGAIEIVGGHGTISMDQGQPHVHMHLTVAMRAVRRSGGMVLRAGHVSAAKVFAVEAVIEAYDGAPVIRALDEPSGLRLWEIGGQG